VFYKEGAKIPEIHCTEIANLISKGIGEITDVTKVATIFQATLVITNFPINATLDQLKKLLINFRDEIYTERKAKNQFLVHFYELQTAKSALSFL
jgi:hypothetical protein